MRFFFIFLISFLISSCESAQQNTLDSPGGDRGYQSNNDSNLKTFIIDGINPIKKGINPPYQGKYAGEKLFQTWVLKLSEFRAKSIESIAKRLGIVYKDENTISFVFSDLPDNEPPLPYTITSGFVDGVAHQYISIFTENIFIGKEPLDSLIALTMCEAVLFEKMGKNYENLPLWLKKGIPLYASGYGETIVHRILNSILETQLFPKDLLCGLVSKSIKYQDMEGYLALKYLEEAYGNKRLKQFFQEIIENGEPWENALSKECEPFLVLQEKALSFSIVYLGELVSNVLTDYRIALKAFIGDDKLRALSMWQRLSFQYPDAFFLGYIFYRIGHTYYLLKNYQKASQYFEDVIDHFPSTCQFLDDAYYRLSLCLLKQGKFAKAIEQLSNFLRDFHFSPLRPRVLFSLAESFKEQHHLDQAMYWYQEFIDKYSQDVRVKEALLIQGKIAQEEYLLHRAKDVYQRLVSSFPDSEEAKEAVKYLAQVETLVNSPPPTEVNEKIVSLIENLETNDNVQKDFSQARLGDIGKWVIPQIQKRIGDANIDLATRMVSILAEVGDSSANDALLLALQKESDELSLEVAKAYLKIGIPGQYLSQILELSKRDKSKAYQDRIDRVLSRILWGTTPAQREKIPDLIVKLEGNTESKLSAIDDLVHFGTQDEVPVLVRLMEQSEEKVSIRAADALYLWCRGQNRSNLSHIVIESFIKALDHPVIQTRCIAIQALIELMAEEAWPKIIQKTKDRSFEVQKVAITAMGKIGSLGIQALITSLEDQEFTIREMARSIILDAPNDAAIPEILIALKNESLPSKSVVTLFQVFQVKTKIPVDFQPTMTLQDRLLLVDKLETLWKSNLK